MSISPYIDPVGALEEALDDLRKEREELLAELVLVKRELAITRAGSDVIECAIALRNAAEQYGITDNVVTQECIENLCAAVYAKGD